MIKKGAHFIAGVMYISIVATTLILNGLFSLLEIVPDRKVEKDFERLIKNDPNHK